MVHELRHCRGSGSVDAKLGIRLACHPRRSSCDLGRSTVRHLAALRRLHPNAHASVGRAGGLNGLDALAGRIADATKGLPPEEAEAVGKR